MQKVLMCRPDFYDIEYEINPWMKLTNKVDQPKALSQWQVVHDAYKAAGIEIEQIEQVQGLPDMTFVANSGIVFGSTFISSNHRYKERKGEEKYFQNWFKKRGFTIKKLKHIQSGEGDALFFRNTLYMGYGFRSEREAHDEVGKILGVQTVSLKLINPYFYDFDMSFCPIGDRAVLYYPEAFDAGSQKILEALSDTIAVDSNEANGFVGNSVLVHNTLFVEYTDAKIDSALAKYGVKTQVFEMKEFTKGGGGIKCITLYLDH